MALGDTSQRFVLEALESDLISQRARENAVDVYYYFNREDTAQGVAALRWEADRAGNAKAKEHLFWAASVLANKWCYPFEKSVHGCDAALTGTLPFNMAEGTRGIYGALIPKQPSPWSFEEYAIARRTLLKGWSATTIHACINHPFSEDSEYDSAIADFIGRNQKPELLNRVMRSVDKPYVLVSDTEVAAYRSKIGKTTAKIDPDDLAPDYQFGTSGPLISVSRVGFSKHGTIAIVYLQQECPSGCSGAAVYVLRRHANFWTQESKQDCE